MMSIFRDLGPRGSIALITIMVFGCLAISHGLSDGWATGAGYVLAGCGILTAIFGLDPDGATNRILGGMSTILTGLGFVMAVSHGSEISTASSQDFDRMFHCGIHDSRCREAALKRAVCGQMLAMETFDEAATSAELGMNTPKEAAPFLDEARHRD